MSSGCVVQAPTGWALLTCTYAFFFSLRRAAMAFLVSMLALLYFMANLDSVVVRFFFVACCCLERCCVTGSFGKVGGESKYFGFSPAF